MDICRNVALVGIAIIGCFRLKTTGYIVDDIPHDNKVYTDLKFFEKNFHGFCQWKFW
jgi:hypothetical protein